MTAQPEIPLSGDLGPALLAVASVADPVPTTAPTPEQIDLIYALRKLAEAIPALLPKVITGEDAPGGWCGLADILSRAAWLCRKHVVIDGTLDREPDSH